MKSFKILFLNLVLLVGLSACQIPFTEKQITLPFFEKKPVDAISLMQKTMFKDVSSLKQEGLLEIIFTLPDRNKVLEESVKEDSSDFSDSSIGLSSKSSYDTAMDITSIFPPKIKILNDFSSSIVKLDNTESNMEISSKISVDLGNMLYSGEIAQKLVDSKQYLMLKSLPSMIEMFIGSYMDKWIEIDEVSQLQSFGRIGATSDFFMDESQENLAEEQEMGMEEKIKEKIKKFKEDMSGVNLFIFNSRLNDEKVDGFKCYHYQVSLNVDIIDKFKDFIKSILTEAETVMDKEEMEKLSNGFNKMKEAVSKKEGEIWIDKKDFYLRKIVFALNLDVLKMIDNEEIAKYGEISVEMGINSKMFDFNQVAGIEAPEDAKSVKEIIEESPVYRSAQIKAQNARRLADIKQVQTALELYYYDESRYPDEVVFDGESSIRSSSTIYMSLVPKNPEFFDNSICSKDFNYEYTVFDKGASYEIKYCFDTPTGGISSGEHRATPAGTNDSLDYLFDTPDSLMFENSETEDEDGDGLDNFSEETFGTDPNNPDSDGDGYSDGSEIENGYNPMGAGSLEDFYKE